MKNYSKERVKKGDRFENFDWSALSSSSSFKVRFKQGPLIIKGLFSVLPTFDYFLR